MMKFVIKNKQRSVIALELNNMAQLLVKINDRVKIIISSLNLGGQIYFWGW